jgi:hypothetical protein
MDEIKSKFRENGLTSDLPNTILNIYIIYGLSSYRFKYICFDLFIVLILYFHYKTINIK